MLKEPVSYNKGFWNPKNFYGLVQQKGPWDNQLIDDLKRKQHVLPEGPVGKGGPLHAGHNYWNLDTGFMDDMNTIDPGRIVKRSRPSLIAGGPFTGGGARLQKVFKKRKSFGRDYKDNLAEFLGLPDSYTNDVEYIDTVYFDTKEPYNKIKSEPVVGGMDKPPKEEIKVPKKTKRGFDFQLGWSEIEPIGPNKKTKRGFGSQSGLPGIEPTPNIEQERLVEQNLNDIEIQVIKEERQLPELLKTDLEKVDPIIVRNINTNAPVEIYKPRPPHPANRLLRTGGNMLATGISYAPGVLQNILSPVAGLLGNVGSTAGSLALEGGSQLGQIAGTAASDLGNVAYKNLPTSKQLGKLIGAPGNLLSKGVTYLAIKGFEAVPIINAGARTIAGVSAKMIKESVKKIPALIEGIAEGSRGYSMDGIPKELQANYKQMLNYVTRAHVAQYGLGETEKLAKEIAMYRQMALDSIKNTGSFEFEILEDLKQIAGPSGYNSMQIQGPAPLEITDANYVDANANRMVTQNSFINQHTSVQEPQVQEPHGQVNPVVIELYAELRKLYEMRNTRSTTMKKSEIEAKIKKVENELKRLEINTNETAPASEKRISKKPVKYGYP